MCPVSPSRRQEGFAAWRLSLKGLQMLRRPTPAPWTPVASAAPCVHLIVPLSCHPYALCQPCRCLCPPPPHYQTCLHSASLCLLEPVCPSPTPVRRFSVPLLRSLPASPYSLSTTPARRVPHPLVRLSCLLLKCLSAFPPACSSSSARPSPVSAAPVCSAAVQPKAAGGEAPLGTAHGERRTWLGWRHAHEACRAGHNYGVLMCMHIECSGACTWSITGQAHG